MGVKTPKIELEKTFYENNITNGIEEALERIF
jgi:hypothetical protein